PPSRPCPPSSPLLFFNDPPPPEIYTLSLHDALPICSLDAGCPARGSMRRVLQSIVKRRQFDNFRTERHLRQPVGEPRILRQQRRSEEHTSELQSLTNLVCRLLLEKKKHN